MSHYSSVHKFIGTQPSPGGCQTSIRGLHGAAAAMADCALLPMERGGCKKMASFTVMTVAMAVENDKFCRETKFMYLFCLI